MTDSLDSLREEMLARIERSGSEAEIEEIRVEALGRKGRLTLLLRGLKDLPAEERPRAGEELNQVRRLVEERLDQRLNVVKREFKERALKEERIDVTLPGTRWE